MTQRELILTPPSERSSRKRVRDTSRAQYREAAGFTGRAGTVLRWLAAYRGPIDLSGLPVQRAWPTAAELANWVGCPQDGQWSWDRHLLHIRRGLSDLQTTGSVESAGKRRCAVSGRTVETWRIPSR